MYEGTIGTGPLTAVINATPMVSGSVPGAPTSLTITVGDSKVTLTWASPFVDPTPAIDYYVVYVDDMEYANTTGTFLTISNLANGHQYRFKVAAHTSIGTGPQSYSVSATPTGQTSASGGGGSILMIALVVVAALIILILVFLRRRGGEKRHSPPQRIDEIQPSEGGPSLESKEHNTEEAKFCPWCGAMESGSEFCGNCGRKIS
ncbi:MAG: fibronectin type III domain-containing protein [Methanomassiliicoccales archaeon]